MAKFKSKLTGGSGKILNLKHAISQDLVREASPDIAWRNAINAMMARIGEDSNTVITGDSYLKITKNLMDESDNMMTVLGNMRELINTVEDGATRCLKDFDTDSKNMINAYFPLEGLSAFQSNMNRTDVERQLVTGYVCAKVLYKLASEVDTIKKTIAQAVEQGLVDDSVINEFVSLGLIESEESAPSHSTLLTKKAAPKTNGEAKKFSSGFNKNQTDDTFDSPFNGGRKQSPFGGNSLGFGGGAGRQSSFGKQAQSVFGRQQTQSTFAKNKTFGR